MIGGRRRINDLQHQQLCILLVEVLRGVRFPYETHVLYPPSKPFPTSPCSKAHQPANLDNFRPPRPFVFPCAAIAESRSKKSKMICARAFESTLRGMKVANESRAMFESGNFISSRFALPPIDVPCSPTLNSSYASHPTTPPGILLQHHLITLHRTYR